ncbi:phosphate signaling complex protein PhoU [uncultured Thiodictyon sp.]|uniref:phosphate signaling complex protein PhoU n=1 Tax=uncultured Thiodictyon sp. TaxID=1846217 RepID=UPI0025F5CD1D|nr:phosphate signaling complex protein PhoU [uncultured Thiodictyon sp.]
MRQSLDALLGHDLGLARETVAGDAAINRQRRLLEQEALLVLAAYQPAGQDLRMIGASMEMVAELERIGDYAADVAGILLIHPEEEFPAVLVEHVAAMGEAATAMLSDAMGSYGRGDAAAARAVAARDDQVDALQRAMIEAIVGLILIEPEAAAPGMALSWIAHHYERVADRATNIAERVVYIATGDTPDLD